MNKIELAKVRDIGQLIGDPFLYAKQNFSVFFKSFAYYAVPPLLVASVITTISLNKIFSTLNPGTPGHHSPFSGSNLGILAVAYIIYILVSSLQQAFVAEHMVIYSQGKDSSIQATMSAVKQDWKIIAINLGGLTAILILGLFVGLGIIRAAAALNTYLGGLIAFILYLFLIYCIIPLSNVVFVSLREKLGLLPALLKSFRITAGNWWKTLLAIIVMSIVFYSLFIVIVIPFYAVMIVAFLHSRQSGLAPENIFSGPIMGVCINFMVFGAFFLMYVYHIFVGINYFHLSEKFDHYSLREAIMKIGNREAQLTSKQEGEY